MANSAWLALDVGGANVKAAHSSGSVRSIPFELWRHPENLAGVISKIATSLPRFDRAAVTMTAELCDCFPTKREGVRSVLESLKSSLAGCPLDVWGTDGRFHTVDGVNETPMLAAASNWLALATVAARIAGSGRGLLVDVGSTTSDLIPLSAGRVDAIGRTDTERLRHGELVYAGVRRTPLFALADRVPFRGRATGLAAELFATTADVFLTLGDRPEDPEDQSTADGRPATVSAARDRLARMVGADREGFSPADAIKLSESFRELFLARLVQAVEVARVRVNERPSVVVVSGSGEFFAAHLASRVIAPGGRVIRLSELWGPDASDAACAHALLEIAEAS